jgi:succinyl-diaminopimelate desuccinylase
LCRALVVAPSPNPPGDTREVASAVASWLEENGLKAEIAAREATAPNVVSTIEGVRPGRHMVLNAHMDTISAGEEAEWSVPIHEVTRGDGKLFGHGIGNMKGALAGMCLALDVLANRRDSWPGRVTLTAVSDEVMFGERGSAFLLESKPFLLGDALLSGEGPGSMGLAVAEKGVVWLELEGKCSSGQGMLVRKGETAVARLAAIIGELDELNTRRVDAPGELAAVEPTPLAFRVSANVGVVRAGKVPSQVAHSAVALVDLRVPPGLTIGDIEAEVARIVAGVEGVSWRRIHGWSPSWTSPSHPFAQAVAEAAWFVRGKSPARVVRLPASDAGRWRRAGVPAVCYGPQPTLAVGVDDYVFEQDLVDCVKVYAIATAQFLTGGVES